MKEYFVYCWYPNDWTPRAIFVDVSKLDDKTKNSLDTITNFGHVIFSKSVREHDREKDEYEEHDMRSWSVNVIELYAKDTNKSIFKDTEEFEQMLKLLNQWDFESDNLHHSVPRQREVYLTIDENNEFIRHEKILTDEEFQKLVDTNWRYHAFEYYINDSNSNLVPSKLREALLQMTSRRDSEDESFKVVECIIHAELDLDDKRNKKILNDCNGESKTDYDIKPLRFFVVSNQNDIDIPLLEESIKNYFQINKVMLVPSKYPGIYGYLTPNDVQQWNKLNKSKYTLDGGIVIIFN